MKRRLMLAIGLVLFATAAAFAFNEVPTEVTLEDRRYAALILEDGGYGEIARAPVKPASFEDEVDLVVAVQDAVLKAAARHEPIPPGRSRELKDLYELKHGFCYDRSRGIEKTLSWLGFEVRHVAVYAARGLPGVLAIVAAGRDSHALTEVLTQKGWMAVDSNRRWIGLDTSRRPVAIAEIQSAGAGAWTWAGESEKPIDPIFEKPFVHVRGLYSRHGYFFPPYLPFPEFNLAQAMSHVWE